METWSPDDWTPNPEFIAKLKKPQLRGLAKRINRLWKELSRKIKEDVKDNPSLYSIIYVPNGFVVPGGIYIKINNVTNDRNYLAGPVTQKLNILMFEFTMCDRPFPRVLLLGYLLDCKGIATL